MAVTVEKVLAIKGQTRQWTFPVASGETIYKGTLAVLDDDGYLRNLSSAYAAQGKLVCYVADGSSNTAPAATTSAGSISSDLEAGSAVAGDKTVRVCYIDGAIRATFTSIAQKQTGKTVYATDNFTVDEAQNSGIKIGSLLTYISATEGWIDLNRFYQHDGSIFWKQAIARSSASGGLFNIANPAGVTIMVDRVVLDLTTGTSGAGTINVGIGASAANADTLIDGVTSSLARVVSNITNHGTNGGMDKAASSEYITGTLATGASGALLAGTVGIWYRYYE